MIGLGIGDVVRIAAQPQRFGNKTALIWRDRSFTYAEVNAQVNRAAGALAGCGVRRGERVAVLGRNCPEYVWLYFALAKLGAIAVPVNFWYRSGEVAYTLRQSDATVLVYDQRFANVVHPALQAIDSPPCTLTWGGVQDELAAAMAGMSPDEPPEAATPEDHHIILYTSGTTGFPKGALFTQAAHTLHALAWALMTEQHAGDVGLLVYPLFHTGGPDCILLPHFLVGGTVVLLDGADPQEMLAAIEQHRATNVFCVPTVWRRLLAAIDSAPFTPDVSSVRRCLGSSDTLPPELLDGILSHFPADVYVTYGLTEAGCILTYSRLTVEHREKIRSVGRPHPLVELRLLDPDGHEVSPGDVGEVCARGPTLMEGYWHLPEQTAQALAGGWLRSGDLGYVDPDGYLILAGRAKDVIITGGEKVYPLEVERLLKQHPGIADVALVGVPDPEWGESVLACVVRAPGAAAAPLTEASLQEWIRPRLAGYKRPRYVAFLDALPVTTATGKVQKAVLREQFGGRYREAAEARIRDHGLGSKE